MNKKLSQIITLSLCFVLIIVTLSGCTEEEQKSKEAEVALPSETKLDYPSILPDWKDGDYHDYYGTIDLLQEFQINYPDLANVFSIGKSVLGKDIWCIRLTNESNAKSKSSCLIDGCIHGCEWEAGEACLYLAEYLLINFDKNDTITNILDSSEIYIVPLLNPDGRQDDSRLNNNGIDLNRNFDIDFGRIRGGALPIGTLFGRVIFTYRFTPRLNKWFPSFPPFLVNSGRRPFSEPESQALRDLMNDIKNDDFSFYFNCHTAQHNIDSPWFAFKPPFEISTQQQYILDYVKEWVAENTEYENAEIGMDGKSYYGSGGAIDWCFKEFKIPTFAIEFLSKYYEPGASGGKHDSLVHWMKTTIPVFMYLLVNIDNLRNWETPDIEPSLPEGVPPEPLK